MASIAHALRQINRDLPQLLAPDFVHQAARSLGHRWRERLLTPVTTLHLLILQILYGNTAYAHLPHLAGMKFTPSAFCQAKLRLPIALLATLLEQLWLRVGQAAGQAGRWKGHRTFAVDGSSGSMPDTPALQQRYGQPSGQKPGCGFPVVNLLLLFDAATGMIRQFLSGDHRQGELPATPALHPLLEPGDLLIGDRAFCSFAHLALLALRGLQALFRMHKKQIVSFKVRRPHAVGKKGKGLPRSRWIRRLGHQDQLVEHVKPRERPRWIGPEDYAALPECLLVRELRYRVLRPGFRTREVTLVTTLLDPVAYPKEELALLYLGRWAVENNLRDLKRTLGMAILKGQSPAMIERELLAFVLVYNLVRLVMCQAARRQGVLPAQISFVDALRWLAHARPGEAMPDLVVNPKRPDRYEPRVVKRRRDSYKLMVRPRAQLHRELRQGKIVGRC